MKKYIYYLFFINVYYFNCPQINTSDQIVYNNKSSIALMSIGGMFNDTMAIFKLYFKIFKTNDFFEYVHIFTSNSLPFPTPKENNANFFIIGLSAQKTIPQFKFQKKLFKKTLISHSTIGIMYYIKNYNNLNREIKIIISIDIAIINDFFFNVYVNMVFTNKFEIYLFIGI